MLEARGGTWYLMCYHARTKNAGKGTFFKLGTGPRLGVFRGLFKCTACNSVSVFVNIGQTLYS